MDTPILSKGAADADLVIDTTTKDFMRDVIDASREVPLPSWATAVAHHRALPASPHQPARTEGERYPSAS